MRIASPAQAIGAALRTQTLLLRSVLREAPAQLLLTGAVVALAAGVLTVAIALFAIGRDPLERARRAAGDPTVLVSGPRSAVEQARRLPGVAAAGPLQAQRPLLVAAPDSRVEVVARTWPRHTTVDRPLLESGRAPRPHALAEIVVERTFARAVGLRTGQVVRLGRHRALIVGIAASVSRPPYSATRDGLVWAPARFFAGANRAQEAVAALRLRRTDAAAVRRYRARVRALAPEARVETIDAIASDYAQLTRLETVVAQTFALLGLVAACFVIATASSGRALSRMHEIGLLRALGVGPRQAASRHLLENLTVAVPAAVIGSLLGLLAATPLLRPFAELFGDALAPRPNLSAAVFSTLIALAAVVVATIPAVVRALTVRTASALVLGRPRGPAGRRSRLAGAALRAGLPPTLALGLAEAFARRPRAWLCVGTVAFAVAMLVALASMERTYARLLADPARDGRPWDVRVEPPTAAGALREAASDARVRVTTQATLSRLPARVAGEPAVVRVVEGAWREMQPAIARGRALRAAGEALVGRRLLERLGVAPGDRVTVAVGGRRLLVRLVGRYVEPLDRAMTLWLAAPTLRAGGVATPRPEALLLRLSDPGRDRVFAAALERRTEQGVRIRVARDIWREERASARRVVYSLDAVLLGIAVANVLCAFLLAVQERARNLALLKVLGVTPGQLAAIVAVGAGALGALAFALGVPLGWKVFETVVVVLNPHDGADVSAWAPPWAVALLLPTSVLLAACAALPPARRAARLKPARTLRSE